MKEIDVYLDTIKCEEEVKEKNNPEYIDEAIFNSKRIILKHHEKNYEFTFEERLIYPSIIVSLYNIQL